MYLCVRVSVLWWYFYQGAHLFLGWYVKKEAVYLDTNIKIIMIFEAAIAFQKHGTTIWSASLTDLCMPNNCPWPPKVRTFFFFCMAQQLLFFPFLSFLFSFLQDMGLQPQEKKSTKEIVLFAFFLLLFFCVIWLPHLLIHWVNWQIWVIRQMYPFSFKVVCSIP